MSKQREDRPWDSRFIKALKVLSPGTPLREGLENVLRAKMGALVVVDNSPAVMEVVDGGFFINCDYSPAAFYELAKMDGALILSSDARKILVANAQLVPSSQLPTIETGTRHRTAERVARQTGALTVAISQRRNIITMYYGTLRYILKDIPAILGRANQALQTLEKYQRVLTKGLATLSALEFEDLVTMGDVASVLIRAEHVRRITREVEHYSIELGSEGRLVSMQKEELVPDQDAVNLLIRDYIMSPDFKLQQQAREQLAALPEEQLEVYNVCRLLQYCVTPNVLDIPVVPRGFRVLSSISRLPSNIVDNLVGHFRTLPRIFGASIAELDEVEGVGEVRAKTIKDGLKLVREQAFLDRHV